MRDKVSKSLATLFRIGYIPFAPGTIGSLVGVGLYFLCLRGIVEERHLPNLLIYLGVLSILFVFGVWVTSRAEIVLGEKDSRYIIIDELTGYLVAMFGLPPRFRYILLAFILFRIFDILKPPPISYIQRIKGGLGIMLDDLAAGIFTSLILNLMVKFKVF